MKKVLLIILVLLLGAATAFWFFVLKGGKKGPKAEKTLVAIKGGKRSEAFNASLQAMLTDYYGLTEGLVNWDTAAVGKYSVLLQSSIDGVKIDELKDDTTGLYLTAQDPIANAKTNVAALITAATLEEKRVVFNQLSDNIRNLLQTLPPDSGVIYWQECPMAFGENTTGGWLSNKEEIRNPYLGTSHPKYKNSMLSCGEIKHTIRPDTSSVQ
ncbi:DUF3347 domain-containing protein [Terrimonas rubra]|uniref:DUF3347 domain-containing protein n=1 Tax=Terrimonas rubra TaxID=1035890 RepID=A0ABW6A7E3_9BACT